MVCVQVPRDDCVARYIMTFVSKMTGRDDANVLFAFLPLISNVRQSKLFADTVQFFTTRC